MININNLDFNKEISLVQNLHYNNLIQELVIEKTLQKTNNSSQYFIKSFITKDNETVCQGYIYFMLDQINKISTYIGTYVRPEYRNSKVASLLTSAWIKLCLENDIYNLRTIRKQRKPFLIYLLKTFSFELQNMQIYENSNKKIHICKKDNDLTKFLFFENSNQRSTFEKSSIFIDDNYNILDNLDNVDIIDSVILSHRYFMKDANNAYKKALTIIDKHNIL